MRDDGWLSYCGDVGSIYAYIISNYVVHLKTIQCYVSYSCNKLEEKMILTINNKYIISSLSPTLDSQTLNPKGEMLHLGFFQGLGFIMSLVMATLVNICL